MSLMMQNYLSSHRVINALSMSRSTLGVAIVPVSAEDIGRRSYEQQYLVEDRIVCSLVEVINQGIHDQVSHGLLNYEICVPTFIYGFPKFNVDYVARKLRELYADRGFVVKGGGRWVRLEWMQDQDPRAQQGTLAMASGGGMARSRKRFPSLPPAS